MILGLIPARGGSKGIPRKNLHPLAGQPLLKWTLDAAKESKLLDHFVVSTEDEEIGDYADFNGCSILWRPEELATDDATTASVLQHAASTCWEYDTIVLLQPTSPIRFRGLIDRCIEKFHETECDTLATGYTSYDFEWGTTTNMPRQKMKGFFYDDGNVYVHKAKHLREGKWWGEKRHPMITEPWYNIELDTMADFWMAEGLMWQLNK